MGMWSELSLVSLFGDSSRMGKEKFIVRVLLVIVVPFGDGGENRGEYDEPIVGYLLEFLLFI